MYDASLCHQYGTNCYGPWQDELVHVRNLLVNRGPQYQYGTTSCAYGYEGNVDNYDAFTTCHQIVYKPSSIERESLVLVIVMSILGALMILIWYFMRERLRRRYLLAKIEKRRNRRQEEPLLGENNY